MVFRAVVLLVVAPACSPVWGAEEGWLAWFNPSLREISREQAQVRRELEALGTPVVGQTVPEFGYMHRRLSEAPLVAPWVQVDLEERQLIDWVALVPAQVDWQPVGGPAYGFPRRFRIDVSDDPEFSTFASLAVFTESDFPEPGIAPVALRARGHIARYVRVTATKLAVENAQHFFALAELMVVSGRRNVAIGRPVRASATVNLPPRWSASNLVDGRTPLGPPVQRDLLPYDGLYTGDGAPAGEEPLWMRVDLARAYALQELRIHPVHARLGADIPGFAFPSRFRVEVAEDPAFLRAETLLDASAEDFPNPGNNPVTVPGRGVTARYVRFAMVSPSRAFNRHRFGLSEIEVFSGDRNVARDATVETAPDPAPTSRDWPRAQLVDGYTSYGRLIELPDYLAGWQRRSELRSRLEALAAEQEHGGAVALQRVRWSGAGVGVVLVATAIGLVVHQRRRRAHELEQLRSRLARDLHDEIGSNLAGLAVMSESVAEARATSEAAREDWREVNRIARETTDAMREVLWVVGAREEAGFDLLAQLQRAAARMLAGRTVVWRESALETLPASWPMEARRQAFLFFKEALANVVRHSGATRVELAASVSGKTLTLEVKDDGAGFEPAAARRGIGLASMHERARALKGECAIDSARGRGTRVTLRVPVGPA
jgi:signal transduction histidine kinase